MADDHIDPEHITKTMIGLLERLDTKERKRALDALDAHHREMSHGDATGGRSRRSKATT